MSGPESNDQDLLKIVRRQDRLLAQELHDSICQSLVSVSLLVQATNRARRAGQVVPPADLLKIESGLGRAIDQSRLFMQSQLVENQPDRLPQALQQLGDWASSSFKYAFVQKGKLKISDAVVALTLYRIARESLQNIAREANARHVKVTLLQSRNELELKISHDGRRYANESGLCILSGDGILPRLARAAGLNWQVLTRAKSTVTLRCRQSQAAA